MLAGHTVSVEVSVCAWLASSLFTPWNGIQGMVPPTCGVSLPPQLSLLGDSPQTRTEACLPSDSEARQADTEDQPPQVFPRQPDAPNTPRLTTAFHCWALKSHVNLIMQNTFSSSLEDSKILTVSKLIKHVTAGFLWELRNALSYQP